MLQSRFGTRGVLLIIVVLALWTAAGCASFTGMGGSSSTTATTTTSELPPPPSQDTTLYYDFPDVPIPTELSLMSDESQVFQGGNFKSGVLAFKGRVDQGSLISFFQATMAKEHWKLLSSIRHHRSALIFQKPDRICLITIRDRFYYTYVEIYVVPTAVTN